MRMRPGGLYEDDPARVFWAASFRAWAGTLGLKEIRAQLSRVGVK